MEASAQKAQAPAAKPRKTSSRTRSERKLAWLLCAPAVLAMMQAVKQTLDPRNLFNPGKVTGDPDAG